MKYKQLKTIKLKKTDIDRLIRGLDYLKREEEISFKNYLRLRSKLDKKLL